MHVELFYKRKKKNLIRRARLIYSIGLVLNNLEDRTKLKCELTCNHCIRLKTISVKFGIEKQIYTKYINIYILKMGNSAIKLT